jgi:transposase-like protein
MTDTWRVVYTARQEGETVMTKGKKYNREFQLQACRLVVEQGYSLKEASERLGPCTWTIREWIKKYRTRGELPGADQVVPEAEELKRLRKENKQLQLENEILKKAAAYFAKDSL